MSQTNDEESWVTFESLVDEGLLNVNLIRWVTKIGAARKPNKRLKSSYPEQLLNTQKISKKLD